MNGSLAVALAAGNDHQQGGAHAVQAAGGQGVVQEVGEGGVQEGAGEDGQQHGDEVNHQDALGAGAQMLALLPQLFHIKGLHGGKVHLEQPGAQEDIGGDDQGAADSGDKEHETQIDVAAGHLLPGAGQAQLPALVGDHGAAHHQGQQDPAEPVVAEGALLVIAAGVGDVVPDGVDDDGAGGKVLGNDLEHGGAAQHGGDGPVHVRIAAQAERDKGEQGGPDNNYYEDARYYIRGVRNGEGVKCLNVIGSAESNGLLKNIFIKSIESPAAGIDIRSVCYLKDKGFPDSFIDFLGGKSVD